MFVSLQTMRIMKQSLEKAGLYPYLMVQPIAYFCPDAGKQGIIDLPEFPFALEPRISTRSAHNIRLLTRSTIILYCLWTSLSSSWSSLTSNLRNYPQIGSVMG